MWRRVLTPMTNRAKLSLSIGENPNPMRKNLVSVGGVPEQDDVIVVGDLAVTAMIGAE